MNPRAVLIDELMIGLDPASIEEVLSLLTLLKNDGVAILISTHIIDIVTDIWDVAYIMNNGQIVKQVRHEDLGKESLKELFFATINEENTLDTGTINE